MGKRGWSVLAFVLTVLAAWAGGHWAVQLDRVVTGHANGFLVLAQDRALVNGDPAPVFPEEGDPSPSLQREDDGREQEAAPGDVLTPVEGLVAVIPIEGTIDEGLAVFVRRAVSEAVEAGAVAVLVEINTFGGRVGSATGIKDALGALDIPVVAFVTHRAWSAGALIALGTDHIAMAPGTSMGAAEPRPADPKVISALRKEFESAAERQGKDPRIAAAMVDASVVIEGLSAEGEVLTLSAQQARELGFIDFIGVRRAEVMDAFGVTVTDWMEAQPNWAERVARFLTDPTVSSILLTLGFLGLIAEISSPGWGVPGTAGIVALGLFFGARLIAGLAGFELVLLFLIGLLLMALEVFVIPGFGIAGIGGLAALLASIYFSFPDGGTALRSLAFSLLAALVLGAILIRFLPRTHAWQRLVLSTQIEEAEEDRLFREALSSEQAALAVGKVGRALTPLRPAGVVEISGERFDAVSEGGFVQQGASVRVQRVEGRKIIVRRLAE